MAFRMSEQPRTIKIYNLLAGTNEFIGEGDAYIPPHTGLPANSTDIAPPDIPLASWLFSTVMSHRGISLKIIGVKRFMTWLPATRYLFLNSVRYRKMLPGYRRKGSFRSGTAQPG
ncbi:putative phage tail fiber assembly protein [Escherichia coli P0304777.12]|nr:putative phage tail fiber assembly protein [Escherichia coli P0304777.12]